MKRRDKKGWIFFQGPIEPTPKKSDIIPRWLISFVFKIGIWAKYSHNSIIRYVLS